MKNILNFKKMVVVVFIATIVSGLFFNMRTAYAAEYVLYGKKMTGGIGNYGNNPRYYWMSSYFNTSAKKKPVTDAMYMWNYSNGTGAWTPLMFYNSAQQYGCILDIHKVSGRPGIGAETTWFTWKGQSVVPERNNWDWCKIEVTNLYQAANSTKQKGTMVHEIGHVLGLAHNDTFPNGGTVMRWMYADTMSKGPTLNDFKGINRLYK
ncbi:hypothetical protein IGI37_000978 [Enterococcus sp. AZ194]|uniref:matrixin family metalloprotease n=1 Tax=Enterococcus sp. AZ194 TaxID=2774629 RepID=UPI003F24A821